MDPDTLKWLMQVATAGGPTGVAILWGCMWWLERAERRALQKQNGDLLVQVLSSMNTTANSMNALVTSTKQRDDTLAAHGNLLNQIAGSIATLSGGRRRG